MQFKIPVPIEKLLKDKNALGYAGRNIIIIQLKLLFILL